MFKLEEKKFKFEMYVSSVLGVSSIFSYLTTSWKLCSYHRFTSPTDDVRSKLSGSNAISFIIFARRTGNSFRRKMKDFFSHAFRPENFNKFVNL